MSHARGAKEVPRCICTGILHKTHQTRERVLSAKAAKVQSKALNVWDAQVGSAAQPVQPRPVVYAWGFSGRGTEKGGVLGPVQQGTGPLNSGRADWDSSWTHRAELPKEKRRSVLLSIIDFWKVDNKLEMLQIRERNKAQSVRRRLA